MATTSNRACDQVYSSYSAWTALGELALYDVDADSRWLDEARRDANGLGTHTRQADGSYALRTYVCVDRTAPGCADPSARVVVDPTIDTAADAWAQHLETAIAIRLAQPAATLP